MQTFRLLDADGNGMLTRQELVEGYKKVYGNKMVSDQIKEEVEEIINKLDIDGDLRIGFSEFAVGTFNKNH